MDAVMRALVVEAARVLLLRFEEGREEVKGRTELDALVAWLGLQVTTFHPNDEQQGTFGYVDPDEDDLIWLRRDLSESVWRFTLAHELGHVVLHCHNNERIQGLLGDVGRQIAALEASQEFKPPDEEDPCTDDDVQEEGLFEEERLEEMLGIGHSYDPRSEREIAANIFAAELLMPQERIKTLYLDMGIAPRMLANMMGVSNTALLNRLAGLLTIKEERAVEPARDEPVVAHPIKKPRYDEFQQAAIEAPTPALIVAGPGSGKTSTLIGRVEYVIRTLQVPAQQILALTFSRKAAGEMEERLRRVLPAGSGLPRVSTFHAYCADLLRQHGGLVGLRPDFTLLDEAEGYFLLRQLAGRLQLRHYQKLHAPTHYFPDMLKAISRAKDELISPQEYAQLAAQMYEQAGEDEEARENALKAREIAHVYALYEEELGRRGDSDFGGLLALTIRLFHEHPEVLQEQQQKYQQILVDEFQDVNRASGVLLRELAGERQQVWVVGDANQAIYGFRGASPANISQFAADFQGAAVLPLSRNYRSQPDLVHLAESFRCRQLEPEEAPGKNQPARASQPEAYVTLAKATNERCELAGLINDVNYKHRNGYAYKDMIVLCRTRAQARKITRALAKAGLPVIERGGTLEQEHIKDVLSIVLLLTDPSGQGILRASRMAEHPLAQEDIETLLLAAREPGTNVRTLLCSGEVPANVSLQGRHTLLRLSDILQTLLRTPDTWSLLAQYLFIESSLIRNALAGRAEKEQQAQLADYERLLQLARHYDQQLQARLRQQRERGEEAAEPAMEERLKGFLEYLSLLVLLRQDGNSRQSAEEEEGNDADIIRVMTAHASKGLEFPVVYMPGLVQRRFPMQARPNPISPPDGMLPPESTGSAAHESGESCLFYVGITRARDALVLSYSERYGRLKYKPSPYLDALEGGLPAERFAKIIWDTLPEEGEQAEEETVILPYSHPSERFIREMRPPTLSSSAIESYLRCPRQYAYSAIYHFKSETDTYQLFWRSVQNTVEELRRQIQESGERIPTRQEIEQLYNQHWQTLGGHNAPFAPLYEEHGQEIVEGVRQQLSIQHEQARWKLRSEHNVDIAGRAVHITVDRIEHREAEEPARFVRTRLGKRKEKPAAELRELFYTLVYRQLYPGQPVELHSHNLSTGELVPIKMTPKKEQSLYDEVEQAVQGLEHNDYPVKPAEPYRCPSCPFFFICPA